MTAAGNRHAVVARALLVSASTILLIALLLNVGVFPVDPEVRPLLVTALTVVGIADIAIALWFRSRGARRS